MGGVTSELDLCRVVADGMTDFSTSKLRFSFKSFGKIPLETNQALRDMVSYRLKPVAHNIKNNML